jgi:hypothetical protein
MMTTHASRSSHQAHLDRCAHACHECQDLCLGMIPHCLSRGGPHADLGHINLLLDCIAICEASRNILHRGSFMHGATCTACAEICEECARDCERKGDDPRMLRCAESCFRCADVCSHVARM